MSVFQISIDCLGDTSPSGGERYRHDLQIRFDQFARTANVTAITVEWGLTVGLVREPGHTNTLSDEAHAYRLEELAQQVWDDNIADYGGVE